MINMGVINLSFLTKREELLDDRILLEKEYSKEFRLKDQSIISLSSTVGLIRDNQQDSMAISVNDDYLLLLLADGMGGGYLGEVASYYTTKIIKDFFEYEDRENLKKIDEESLTEVLYTVIYEINRRIPYNSGTTLSFALITPDSTYLINIGDSRIYSLKDDLMKLESYDDSVSFEKYRPLNDYERDKLRFYKNNNQITNCIMKGSFPRIRVKKIDNNSYDILCLLSDGISDILSEFKICECLFNNNSAYLLTELSKTENSENYELDDDNFFSSITLGKDNASSIVYKKIKNKR